MKKSTCIYLLLIVVISTLILKSCKKKDVPLKEVPILTTMEISNITATTATCGGNITDEGSSHVISRGICWNTSSGPTIADNITSDGTGAGAFISNLSDLKGSTTYYVSAYATNAFGTGYGSEISFTTSLYDLFPLKVGNEFYYSYSYSYSHDVQYGPFKRSNGKRKWRILTDSLKINSVEYSFEEKYNGVEITTIKIPTTMVDTININDSIRYFKVIEDKSGQLSFWNLNTTWNITLQRFQKDSDIVIHNWAGTNYQRDYQFHANKGLINYTNGKGPISNQYSENYKLDSVKLIH